MTTEILSQKSSLSIYSSFNCELLCRYLSNFYNFEKNINNFGMQDIYSSLTKTSKNMDLALIWTLPSSISPSFTKIENFYDIDHDIIIDEVKLFCDLILQNQEKFTNIFITSIFNPFPNLGYGILDRKNNLGISNLVSKMNIKMEEILSDEKKIFFLEEKKWLTNDNFFDPKMWYYSKSPFSNVIYKNLSECLLKSIYVLNNTPKKVIVCDLDNTMWGGVIGDIGWEKLNIGGHDAVGEAYLDFQKSLKSLTRKGFILAIASKNEESIALEAFENHPEMIISKNDVAAWEINWNDKANNIIKLSKKLNLTLSSFVFLDDNLTERTRVKETLPDVLVPDLPKNVLERPNFINTLDCFDRPQITSEDKNRSKFYLNQKTFNDQKEKIGNLIDLKSWLKTLNIIITPSILINKDHPRTVQLINKTNQLNLTTRRLTISELLDWIKIENNFLYTYRVSDRIGESGLTGIASFSIVNEIAYIKDFILSCRVAGKDVEKAMIFHIIKIIKQKGLKKVFFEYKQTKNNIPLYKILKDSELKLEKKNTFTWKTIDDYPYPETNILNNF